MKKARNFFGSCAAVATLSFCLWPACCVGAAEVLGQSAPAPQHSTQFPPAVTHEAEVLAAPETWTGGLGQSNQLRLNFKGAPLKLVLEYLSEAAGFVIDQETEVTGTVDAWSKEPVTREEAVALLNSSLRKNGAGVLRQGRILKVLKLDTAKTADLEIIEGNNPDAVQKSEELVTQIIPVRYANATQLVSNLQLLLPTTASLTANESANSLVLVATKTDVRRVLKIISALDSSIARVSSIKVLPLRYGDAKQLATVIQQLFAPPTPNQSGGGQNLRFDPGMGFGFGGGGPGGFGPRGGGFDRLGPGSAPVSSASGSSGSAPGNSAVARNPKVNVVADEYSNSLVVSAPADMIETITNVVRQVDRPAAEIAEVRVFRLVNADPSEIVDQLTQLFPDAPANESTQNAGEARFGPPGEPFRPPGEAEQTAAGSSERATKKVRLVAVADPRTSSVLVSAGSALMEEVVKLIDKLDARSGKKELVKVWDLHNADPRSVNQVLQDLFNRNGAMRNNNDPNSLLGEDNALTMRETQQQTTPQTGLGSRAGGVGASGGLGGSTFGSGAGY